MKMIITDTLGKADTLTQKLGADYLILPLLGCVKTFPQKDIGLSVEGTNINISLTDDPRSMDSIHQIEDNAKNAEGIYLAMEPDREGAFKAYYLYKRLSEASKGERKEIKNIVLHELTQQAIHEALQNPIPLDSHSVSAHLTRRIFDRLTGYNIGAELAKQFGRCVPASIPQAIAVKVVMDKERSLKGFHPMTYCELSAMVNGLNFTLHTGEGKKNPTYLQKTTADTLMGILEVKSVLELTSIETCERREEPPQPFSTMTMLQAAHKVLGYSVEDTMSFAQNLYEWGYITFYKTRSTAVSENAMKMAHEYINGKYGESYIGTKQKSNSSNGECIRPTRIVSGSELPELEKKLFQMICKRFLASQMADCKYSYRFMKASNPSLAYAARKNERYADLFFSCMQKTMVCDGYRKMLQPEDVEYEMLIGDPSLNDALKESDSLDADFFVTESQTTGPQRYTEGTLVKELDAMDIAVPETVVSMVKSLKARNFVNQNSAQTIEPTELCRNVYDYLQEHYPSIINEEYAAAVERRLEQIEKEGKWKHFGLTFYEELQRKDANG